MELIIILINVLRAQMPKIYNKQKQMENKRRGLNSTKSEQRIARSQNPYSRNEKCFF